VLSRHRFVVRAGVGWADATTNSVVVAGPVLDAASMDDFLDVSH
jgi:hypothetical protein